MRKTGEMMRKTSQFIPSNTNYSSYRVCTLPKILKFNENSMFLECILKACNLKVSTAPTL